MPIMLVMHIIHISPHMETKTTHFQPSSSNANTSFSMSNIGGDKGNNTKLGTLNPRIVLSG